MPSVLPLRAPDADVHILSVPIRAFGARRARFFGILTAPEPPANNGARGKRAAAARTHVATLIENIVAGDDSGPQNGAARAPPDIGAWFAACVARIHTALTPPTGHPPPLSACLGVSVDANGRRAVTIAPAGAMGVRAVVRNARGIPVISTLAEPGDPIAPLRFTQALDGALGPHDALIIGTPALAAAVPDALLRRAFAARTLGDAVAQLDTTLARADVRAAGIVVCGSSVERPQHSQASMESFLRTTAATERFLTPALAPAVRSYTDRLWATTALLRDAITRRRTRTRSRRTTSRSSATLRVALHAIGIAFATVALTARGTIALLIDAFRIACIGALGVLRVASHLRTARTRTTPRPPIAHRLRAVASRARAAVRDPRAAAAAILADGGLKAAATQVLRHTTEHPRARFAALPRQSQILLTCAVGFGILFLASTGALWRRRVTEADVASYNTVIGQIEELRAVGEARLLFGDRDEARAAFVQADTLVRTLARTSRPRRERAALLEREVTASLDRSRLLTRIAQPLRVAAAGDTIPFPAIADATMIGGGLIAVAGDHTALARVAPRTGDVTRIAITPTPQLTPPIRALALDDRTLVLLDRAARAVTVDTITGAASPAAIEQPPPAIADAATYRKRLYLLHPDGAITRHDRTAGGFSRGTMWLRAPENTRAATIVALGPIFVGANDGSVSTYESGRPRDSLLTAHVDPPPAEAPLLAGTSAADAIAIGIPTEGRIAFVKPDGILLGQLQSDAFRGMTALAFSPTDDSLFVLRGGTISVVVPPR